MSQCGGFIYKIIGIGIIFLCLFSCAPKPELEWVPEIRAVSAKVTDNTCVLMAETSTELTDGYACGFIYGKSKDDMKRVKAKADGKKFNIILESLDYDTDYVYRAYVGNGRNEICSDISYFRILKEKEIPRSMILPFDKIELESRESEFLVEVGGDADFTVNIPDTVSWIFYRRDNRNCRFQVKANTETDDRRCDVVFTNLSDNQSDTLSVVQAAKVNYGDDYIDEYGINHGPGVKIGETVWAPVNCGYHPLDFKYGKLYQWGRKYGQGYEGGLMDGDDYNAGEFSDVSVPEIEAGPVDLAIGQSKENKNKFYYGSDNYYYWCTDQKSNFWNSGTEENPVKTEYDPCPDGWRVPAYAELEQLSFNYSSWITDENSQPGYWFSGPGIYAGTTPQVFFPAAGLRTENGMCTARGGFGFYWSSRPMGHDAISILCFCNTEVGVDVGNPRATGCSVRCVQDDSALIPVANITLSKTSMSLSVGNSETITYSIAPSNANHQSAHWWSDNPEIASVDQNGNVAGVSGGATIIYAMAGMQVETCSVTVTGASNPRDYIDEYGINHGPGVTIGGTVWAPVNCGYHAEDFKYGKLYQWGRKYGQGYDGDFFDMNGSVTYYSDASAPEIEAGPVDSATGQSEEGKNKFYYSLDTTSDWCAPKDDGLWNSGTEESPVKTEYDPCPDGWRVPTVAELDELSGNHSSWITDENGQSGFYFSGSNVYSETVPRVFFPASGFRFSDGMVAYGRGTFGSYWSSSLVHDYYSRFLDFSCWEATASVGTSRATGLSVRCVKATDEVAKL